jgi:hypothetical protein
MSYGAGCSRGNKPLPRFDKMKLIEDNDLSEEELKILL